MWNAGSETNTCFDAYADVCGVCVWGDTGGEDKGTAACVSESGGEASEGGCAEGGGD